MLHVLDLNNHRPEFTEKTYAMNVSEVRAFLQCGLIITTMYSSIKDPWFNAVETSRDYGLHTSQ